MTDAMLALALTLSACGGGPDETPATPSPGEAQRERVVLSPIGLSLSVPPGYAVYPQGPRELGPWVVEMNPEGRQPRRIVVSAAAPEQLAPPSERGPDCPWEGPFTADLSTGSTVSYYSSVGCGGSGGVEAALTGLWRLGERRYVLSCLVQGEPGLLGDGPDPTGCLQQLRSARAVLATDTPVRLGPTGTERGAVERVP